MDLANERSAYSSERFHCCGLVDTANQPRLKLVGPGVSNDEQTINARQKARVSQFDTGLCTSMLRKAVAVARQTEPGHRECDAAENRHNEE
jgi:hypothetical protein